MNLRPGRSRSGPEGIEIADHRRSRNRRRESCHPVQLTARYETPCLGFGKHSGKAGYFQATVDGDAAATLFIDEQKVGLQFGGYNDGFRTWIELPPGAPQPRSGFGLRRHESTTGQAGLRSWRVRPVPPEELRSPHYRSRSKWSLSTAARLRIGEVSETTIKRRAATSPAEDLAPSLQDRSEAESAC